MMTKCSKCGTYGHNARTCKLSPKEIRDLKKQREEMKTRQAERAKRSQFDQVWAFTKLVDNVAESLDAEIHTEVDHHENLIVLFIDENEYHGADAIHVLVGMLLQANKEKESSNG